MKPEDVTWLLWKIKHLEDMNSPRRRPTHRNIWAGSYDVWSCKQDEIDAIEIPRARMKEALEAGYIKSEIVPINSKYSETVYSLTDAGKTLLAADN